MTPSTPPPRPTAPSATLRYTYLADGAVSCENPRGLTFLLWGSPDMPALRPERPAVPQRGKGTRA